jgi:hypothetical protein
MFAEKCFFFSSPLCQATRGRARTPRQRQETSAVAVWKIFFGVRKFFLFSPCARRGQEVRRQLRASVRKSVIGKSSEQTKFGEEIFSVKS